MEASTQAETAAPLEISDVILTIDRISDMYKSRSSQPMDNRLASLSELEKKCREFLQIAESNNALKGSSKLRADAPAFLPAHLRVNAPLVPDPASTPPSNADKKLETSPVVPKNDAKTLPDDWEETLRKEVAEATELVWAQAEAWIEAEAEAEEEEWRILEMGINNYVGLASSELDAAISSPGDWLGTAPPGLEGSNRRKGLSVSTFFEDPILETPLVGRTDESRIIRSARSAKSLDDRYDSPTTSYFSLAGNLSGRGALHSKLSSPDRRRFISPADALKRYESKLSVAETNRDRSVAAKVQKAMQVTNRVKERMQRAAEKHQLAEEALQDKLKHAEKRHEKHINGIRVRAGNENAKVNGVLFSTLANSEAIAQALQQKLEEVEARILAASQRREQRLAGISGSQRKKNSRKVQQMSEFKMQLERQKMERWEKLQQKLEQVKSRREARFAELKLRAEADARRLEALLAEKAAEKATERDSTSTSTPKRVRQSESALQPNTPQLLNAAEQQTTPSTSPNPEPVALPLTEFPASPPRIARGSDDSASPCSLPQLLSTTSLKLSFLKFQDSIQKAKVLSTFDDAWEQCLKIAHSSASNGLIGIRCLVHEATSSRTDADRIDSGSKLYSSILEQLNNMEEPGIAETVNCIVQGALDNARAGHWDRLKDFAEQGGVLLSSAVLSRDLGTLRSFQSLCSFLELSKPSNMADDISRDQIEFGNLLELLDLMMNSPDETMKKLMLSHGLHLSIADIIHFLLLFASSKMVVADPGPSIGETSPVTPQLLRSGLHVNSMLCKLSEILLALITTAQELSQSSSECMELLRSFMDYCFLSNMMALVVQYGQVVLAETQCESASKPSTPSQSTDAFVLRNIEGRRAFWSVSNLVQAIAGYVSSLRKRSGVAGGIQVKHWQSHFRRNGLFALLCNLLALVSDDMAIVALWPSRHSRGLGSATSFPSVVIDHAAQLQSLGMSLVRSVNAVLHAEQEAFQHLIKDQQVRLILSLQQAICFYCTTITAARPFPMLGVTPLEAEPSHCGAREEAVADICAVVGAVCQHDVDARHQIGAVVGSGRSASSASTSPLTSPGQSSLLATLASLPVRLMKEQRVKNLLMPCLIVACLEVEANVSIVRRCGKASYVRKYLDSAVAERMEITRESSEDSSRRAMERLASLVQVLPIEMWEVALLTWSSGESVRTAKI